MEKEMDDLTKRKIWDIVPKSAAGDNPIIPGVWSFLAKRFPSGVLQKFKARFCVRGGPAEAEERAQFGFFCSSGL